MKNILLIVFAVLLYGAPLSAQAPTSYNIAAGSAADTCFVGGFLGPFAGLAAPYNDSRYFTTLPATCNLPIANGVYTFTLREMEGYFLVKQARIFSATVNGIPIFTNLDLVADAGAKVADDKSVQVTVTNGMLTLVLTSTVNYPQYNAIVVTPVAGPPPPPPPPPPGTFLRLLLLNPIDSVNSTNLLGFGGCPTADTGCTQEVQVCDDTTPVANCLHFPPGPHTVSIKLVANVTLPAPQTNTAVIETVTGTIAAQ